MHGRASPGASQVNHFHSGRAGLCTQPMANKLSVGGIFTLSMTFGASLNWEGVFVGTTHTLLNAFGLLEGTKRSKVAVISGTLPSEVIFWIPPMLNWHTVQAPWENKTEPPTSHSVRFTQPWYGSTTCKKMSIFFSPPAVHRPLSRCGRACTFPKTFPHRTPN